MPYGDCTGPDGRRARRYTAYRDYARYYGRNTFTGFFERLFGARYERQYGYGPRRGYGRRWKRRGRW